MTLSFFRRLVGHKNHIWVHHGLTMGGARMGARGGPSQTCPETFLKVGRHGHALMTRLEISPTADMVDLRIH